MLSHFQYCSTVWYHCSATNARCIEQILERALKCVYSNYTALYESLLNKSCMPSLEVGRQMYIAIQIFKILNDLASDLKTLSHPQLRKFLKYPENTSHKEGATCPKNLFAKGIENNQRPQNLTLPARVFFCLIQSIMDRCRFFDQMWWYSYLTINQCEMFYVPFIHIINIINIINHIRKQYKFSYIIFNLLLCAKMYYVSFNHIIYVLI